ncbi:Crp/Fnr family transcriptional regulator [Lysobacter capsici]|uniref:Crp/Fnr family transcriptional regulator n=1 Tax=Lysobacter capsici TaxID=435897 RepID=UPI000627F2BB|nr:Crp/Fnr family transcriptional regulator [Lysobacter capsici]
MGTAAGRLSLDLVRLLAERGDVRRLERGEVLIHEGDLSQSLFVLLSGQLRVFTQDKRGREVIYNTLDAPEILGEMFLDGGPRSASVKAITQVECIEVDDSKLRDFMRQYPDLSESLMIKLIERLRHATQQVRSLALDDVFARTVDAINEHAVSDAGRRYLPASVTQRQIASGIGATREMVNHVFRHLAKAGFLVRDGQAGWWLTRPLPRQ